ncbi:MAG: hypothetical protein KGQ81_03650, partial [Cyanobacteria bacterium REEB498]|nr:hypothetical protein [Cyanobacteria bacterium REEB498]
MLTPATRIRLQEILERIRSDAAVSLEERIYVQKFADRNHMVAGWLHQARREQQAACGDGLERLMAQLDLGPVDPRPP